MYVKGWKGNESVYIFKLLHLGGIFYLFFVFLLASFSATTGIKEKEEKKTFVRDEKNFLFMYVLAFAAFAHIKRHMNVFPLHFM
jgi:hypothetical protein